MNAPPDARLDWEDAKTTVTLAHADRYDAAWILTRAPFWVLIRRGGLGGPIVLGVVLFAIVVAMVVLAPSAESHFIYTDF